MSADLMCKPCEGTGHFVCRWPGCEQRHPRKMCLECHGRGRRQPEVREWDALVADRNWLAAMLHGALRVARRLRAEQDALEAERDRYHKALYKIVQFDDGLAGEIARTALTRAALDSNPDLAERTRRIRADE